MAFSIGFTDQLSEQCWTLRGFLWGEVWGSSSIGKEECLVAGGEMRGIFFFFNFGGSCCWSICLSGKIHTKANYLVKGTNLLDQEYLEAE